MDYYYVSNKQVIKTDRLAELVVELYRGARFIDDSQRKELGLSADYIYRQREAISRFADLLPMYDIRTNRVKLSRASQLYDNLTGRDYRFLDEEFYQELYLKRDPDDRDRENLRISSHYNFNTLTKTCWAAFYDSYRFRHHQTDCVRPSFYSGIEHVQPYYRADEVYYLAYDWGLKKTPMPKTMEQVAAEVRGLCSAVAKHDIPARTLLSHQDYVYRSNSIGLVKYYSLYGAYSVNDYLRNPPPIADPEVEAQIGLLTKLIRAAPPFDADHTVYRFVSDDKHLRGLAIGDVYRDKGFTSVTRNPFQGKKSYSFGDIMIKIELPKGIPGVGLAVESYSNFPLEQEIILLAMSRLVLKAVVTGDNHQDKDALLNLSIVRKYVFKYKGNEYIDKPLPLPTAKFVSIKTVDLSKIKSGPTVAKSVEQFRRVWCNENGQFKSGDLEFTLSSYDSSAAYRKFYYYETVNGMMITSINREHGNIQLLVEIGEQLHVNYYFRFSLSEFAIPIDVEWLSWLAHAFGIRTVVLHPKYQLSPASKNVRYTHCADFYEYLLDGRRAFQEHDVSPGFDYSKLDLLKTTSPSQLFTLDDDSPLEEYSHKFATVSELYLHVVDTQPELIEPLVFRLGLLYQTGENPFVDPSYYLDAYRQLYNAGKIEVIPIGKNKGSFRKAIDESRIKRFPKLFNA